MPSKTLSNASKTQRKIWRRVRRLSETTGTPISTARKAYKNLSEAQKKALDILEIPKRRFQTPKQVNSIYQEATKELQETQRRPSKGDPTRPVRAGAPQEYIKTAQEPALVTIRALRKLKEICQEYFAGDWNLLKQSAETIKTILAD